jgi:hypothetical protein
MMLREVLLAAVLSSVPAFSDAAEYTLNLNAQAPISVVGSFSNMRYTNEHAYGYAVELWRSSDCFFGIFFSSSGLNGDAPAGLIENIKYDKKTGAISFSARLTMGEVSPIPGKDAGEPSKDIYEFTGVLKNNSLGGAVLHEILNLPAVRPHTPEKVVLKPSPEESKWMPYLPTYSQWELAKKDLLKRRGPKW